jgi:hypothetical protein
MMKRRPARPVFYRVREGRRLHGFGDPVPEVPVLGRPLGELQRLHVEANGGELRDVDSREAITDESYFVFDEDLFFTREYIAGMLKIAGRSATSLRFGVEPNSFNERFVLPHEPDPAGNLRFNLFRITSGSSPPRDVTVPQEVFPSRVPLPAQIVREGVYSCDQCPAFVSRMASPFHLLQVNLAANLNRLATLRSRLPQRLIDRVAPLHSTLYRRALRSLNRLGRGCRIHPTAVLENAVLEDGVTVGAHSIVRHSYVGAGTTLNDNVSVVQSVLGRNNVVASGNVINLCMTYDDVFLIHGPYQFSIFGRSSAVFAVINCDIRLDQRTIVIPTDVGMLDSMQPLLGIAYGHRSKVGGGNIIAAGRIVPNDRSIAPPPTILLKMDG